MIVRIVPRDGYLRVTLYTDNMDQISEFDCDEVFPNDALGEVTFAHVIRVRYFVTKEGDRVVKTMCILDMPTVE